MRIEIPISLERSFWESNPQFKYVDPFKKIKALLGKEESSNFMYSLWMFMDISKENQFRKMPLEKKIQSIRNFYPDFDPESDLFEEAMDSYSLMCMDVGERSFKQDQDTLTSRTRQMRAMQKKINDMLSYDGDDDLVGSAGFDKLTRLLETMRKNTTTVYKNYAEAEALFVKEESKREQLFGGGRLTVKDRGQLKELPDD